MYQNNNKLHVPSLRELEQVFSNISAKETDTDTIGVYKKVCEYRSF